MTNLALVSDERATLALTLCPLERIERLCDPGSVHVFRSGVASRGRRSEPGDGVVVAAGTRAGRPLFAYAQDAGSSAARSAPRTASRSSGCCGWPATPARRSSASSSRRARESTRAPPRWPATARSSASRCGYRAAARRSASSPASPPAAAPTSPALADFVVMTGQGRLFLTGPGVVREVMGEDVGMDDLGGPDVHARNGVCHLNADSDREAIELAGALVDHLPQHPAGGAAAGTWFRRAPAP